MSKPKPSRSTRSTKATGSKRASARAAASKNQAPPSRATAAPPERPQGRSDDADAFIRERGRDEGPSRSGDDLAEVLGEDFLESATRGNEVFEDEVDAALPDEVGGPFVVTRSSEELADDVDASNPPDAEPAGRPKAVAGLVQRPRAEALAEDEDEGEGEDEDEDEEDDEDEDEEIEDELEDEEPKPR